MRGIKWHPISSVIHRGRLQIFQNGHEARHVVSVWPRNDVDVKSDPHVTVRLDREASSDQEADRTLLEG